MFRITTISNETPAVHQKVKGQVAADPSSKLEQVSEVCECQKRTYPDKVRVAPAYYIGRQEMGDGIEGLELYNLTADIPGHPKRSTVSGKTLEAAGFRLPSRKADTAPKRASVYIGRIR